MTVAGTKWKSRREVERKVEMEVERKKGKKQR